MDIEVPVLIVGGGGCGLTASIFLSNLGVDHLLVEKHQTTSSLPKASYLNQRTMEILRAHGAAEPVYAGGAKMSDKYGRIRWQTSLGGNGPLDGRTFFEIDGFGGGSLTEIYERHGPCLPTNLPQIRLEPVLRELAERRGPQRLRFGHEVLSLEQDGDGVTTAIVDRVTDQHYTVRSQYVFAADGGKTIGPLLGIGMQGPTNMTDMVSAHIRADLSAWWPDDALITFFLNPDGGGSGWSSGAMVQLGPTWGAQSEEFQIVFAFRPDDPARFDENSIVPKVRALLKLPDLELSCVNLNHWIVEGVIAEKYQTGRVFLGGDAAHRHPPTTGLGLNGAIQDAHNLAWKLAWVLNGRSSAELLSTYQTERRAVGIENVEWALFTFANHGVVDAALGMPAGAPAPVQRQAFEQFLADTKLGAAMRARFAEVATTQRVELQAHDIEVGFHYDDGAIVPDGTPAPARDPMGCEHQPTTRPGHLLPHAWLIGSDGTACSTHDFTGASTRFVLISGPTGAQTWSTACAGVDVVVIGDGGGYTDPSGEWERLREIPDDGAILVRPDNHVAWRGRRPEDLNRALAQLQLQDHTGRGLA
jgi:2,4-dichlorophenol 6-monooxygenase